MDSEKKTGIPFKDIPGTTMVADEVSDDRLIQVHPFPWTVRAPEFMSDEHDVIDAIGTVVMGDVDPDTAKVLLGALNEVAISQLTHGFINRDPDALAGPINLEPGAVHVLDAAGEREIQRIAEEVSPQELERMIGDIKLGPFPMETPIVPDPRIATLEGALVEVVNVLQSAIPNSRGLAVATSKTIDIAKRVGLAHRVRGNPDGAEEGVISREEAMARQGKKPAAVESANRQAREAFADLGLAGRLPGNPTEAEEDVA